MIDNNSCQLSLSARSELATKPGFLNAAASLHGLKYDAEKGARIAAPFFNMASQNEGEQPDFMDALPSGIKEKSKFKLFDDVPHGFAAARGDWKANETHRKRAEEAIVEFVEFVKDVVP
jgi:dienelactone hydrolase